MNTWFRKVGMGAVALTLAGVLGGCNNGSGGGSLLRLYFGINGSGSCNSVVVDVNLDDAGAIIARDEFGDVQCAINPALDSQGCDISFSELPNGDLRAIIDDCTIPAVTNLFSCLFEDVDISELQETATAQCSCTTQNCDGTPPVCISLDPDPRSCEDCDNGVDDDGNGLVDCDDPNCFNAPECNGTTTTSTTSTTGTVETTSTTNTTSTTVSTTTSTTEQLFTCNVRFRLMDDVTVGALQWDTDYSNAPGFFLGQGGNVECASLIENAIAAFNDEDAMENLDSGLASTEGFTGPVSISECTFLAPIQPVAGDFTITVTEAADPDLNLINPLPDVVIESINCDLPDTTTTTTIQGTTTTMGPTTTTIGGTAQDYNVKYTLTARSGDKGVGALQWVTDYATATGEFPGSGGAVSDSCKVGPGAPGSLFAPNDVDGTRMLTIGIVSFGGFSPVADIANCLFAGDSSDPPVPGDFPITIEDATDVDGAPITATITVTVTEIP